MYRVTRLRTGLLSLDSSVFSIVPLLGNVGNVDNVDNVGHA